MNSKILFITLLLIALAYFSTYQFFHPPEACVPMSFEDSIKNTSDYKLLSAIINAEAGPNPTDLMDPFMIGSTVLNRLDSPGFPKTMRGVVKQANQFKGISNNNFRRTDASDEVALKLLSGKGRNCSTLFFYGHGSVKWKFISNIKSDYRLITVTNSHVFYGT